MNGSKVKDQANKIERQLKRLLNERAQTEKAHNRAIRTAFYGIFDKEPRDAKVAELIALRDAELEAIDAKIIDLKGAC